MKTHTTKYAGSVVAVFNWNGLCTVCVCAYDNIFPNRIHSRQRDDRETLCVRTMPPDCWSMCVSACVVENISVEKFETTSFSEQHHA